MTNHIFSEQFQQIPDAPPFISQAIDEAQQRFANDVDNVLNAVRAMLIEKNRKYGDAALNPQQTFAKCDAIELIRVRMDDKLSRIRNAQTDEDEDPYFDLLGYLVIHEIAKMRKDRK